MTQTLTIFLALVMLFFSTVHACTKRNNTYTIYCHEIKTDDGYKFNRFNPTMAAQEREVSQNGTTIATSKRGKFNFSSEVVHMDKNSITTRKCMDLQVKSIIENKRVLISEHCVNFKVVDDMSQTQEQERQNYPTALITVVGLFGFVLVGIGFGYIPWKKKREKKRQGVSVCLYIEDIVTCSCFRKRKSDNSNDNIQDNNAHNSEIERCLQERDRDGGEADGQNTDNAVDTDGDVTTTNGCVRVSVVSGDRIHQEIWGMDGPQASENDSPFNSAMEIDGLLVYKIQWLKKPTQASQNQSSAVEAAGGEAIELVDSFGPGSESST